jgi:hypothetical protein
LTKYKHLEQKVRDELDHKTQELINYEKQYSVLEAQKNTETKDSRGVLDELRRSGMIIYPL